MSAERPPAGPDGDDILVYPPPGETLGGDPSTRNFNAMLYGLTAMYVQPGMYRGNPATMIRRDKGLDSRQGFVVITQAETEEEKRRIEESGVPLAAFADNTSLDPANDEQLFTEAKLRSEHRGLVKMALGLIGEAGSRRVSQKSDEQFYKASLDIIALGSVLARPLHSEAEIMGANASGTVLGFYRAAFASCRYGYIAEMDGTIDDSLLSVVDKSLGKIIHDISQPGPGPEPPATFDVTLDEQPDIVHVSAARKGPEELENAMLSKPVAWLLAYFDQEDYQATVSSVLINEPELQVRNVLDKMTSDEKRDDFAQTAIRIYCQGLNDRYPGNKLIEAMVAALSKEKAPLITVVKAANVLVEATGALGGINGPAKPLKTKVTEIPEAFRRLRGLASGSLGAEEEEESLAKLGQIVELILAVNFSKAV